ncbi:flagellar basal-body MS-ring/collar protein FliF [Massilia aquatica]|uniref:Flagellar M-ring protein n=1 Tax=Massilia aquatica TaxID=2609000 RepID=A0ABX0MDU4_9BURK|nr:flagellar M-ring protein FliF [Massilia aquatica]
MTAFNDYWQRADQRARTGLVIGVLLIAALTVALGALLLRTDYQVLFSDLAPQDAATMTAELDKLKTPYRLSGDGNTILVPAEMVHRTRLKLVAKELPLRGAVGLELFNSSEVGMTEFTQKVNYQRALQGELTRTILSLDEVATVRVHLVMAEQALFKKNVKQAKASISIAMKPGRTLDTAQVQGIQRLVAAAVPDIRASDVTIVDHNGVALTRRSGAEGDEGAAGGDSLDDKRALETYLNKKISAMLDRTFGPGQGIASVDVTLNHKHIKTTTENVLGKDASGEGEGAGAGVMVRERMTSRDGPADASAPAGAGPANGTVTSETDYQVGRRVEQVVASAGAISRVNVAVVVSGALDQARLDRVRDVVALAAGIDKARGDAVAVYSMDQMATVPAAGAALAQAVPAQAAAPAAIGATSAPAAASANTLLLALGALIVLAVLALAWRLFARPAQPQLTLEQRRLLLNQVNDWLDAPAAARKDQF